MPRYRSRRTEFDAIQWTGNNLADLVTWAGYNMTRQPDDGLSFTTAAGSVWASLSDWIIRDDTGHFRTVSPAAFARLYEPCDPT